MPESGTGLLLHRVFHGIRFKVNNEDCGCRETTISFLYPPVVSSHIYPLHLIYSCRPSQRAVFVSTCVRRIGATGIRRTSFWRHCSIPFITNAPEAVGAKIHRRGERRGGHLRQPVPILFIRIREIVSVGKRPGGVCRTLLFPPRETDLQQILPPSRRTKAFFGGFFPFPAAGNRFSENFSHFPPREGVFLRIYPISRRGKAFLKVSDRFRVSFWRFQKILIGFARREGVLRSSRSVSRFILAFRKSITPSRESDVRITPAEKTYGSHAMAKSFLKMLVPAVQGPKRGFCDLHHRCNGPKADFSVCTDGVRVK